MEVAVHSVSHPHLALITTDMCAKEVLLDRINLEQDCDLYVRGMAYPCNSFSDDVVTTIKQCGIVYARTTNSTGNFSIPDDWLRLNPTCHHNDPKLMELAKCFVEKVNCRVPLLFYVWGHSHEFDVDNNWNVIEELAEYVGNRDEIWYATNIDIYDYITAFRQLIFSMNEKRVYNPTNKMIYFEIDGTIYCVRPGDNILETCRC